MLRNVAQKKPTMKLAHYIFLSLFFVAVLGCNKSQSPEPGQSAGSSASQNSPTPDKSRVGDITGVISFKGVVPKLSLLDSSADPACPADPQPQDAVVINNGKLANVFVYVKNGLGQTSFTPSSQPVVLDQKGCRYIPHVLGLIVGQPLKVLNDDNAQHNIHPMPAHNEEWNESQMPRGQPIIKTFQHPEMMIPVQCNQHPWMRMYLNVMDNPFFAVSGGDGSFQIKDLPAGEYTLAAVHEKFGEQDVKVTVAPEQTASAKFVFSSGK